MPFCSKCGTQVSEDMIFCPNCGSSLKQAQAPMPLVFPPVAQPSPVPPRRAERYEKEEKREKQEKNEPGEKAEKHEKGERGYLGPVIAGLILIALGIMFYMGTISQLTTIAWPSFLIFVGIILIAVVIYGALAAEKRNPRP